MKTITARIITLATLTALLSTIAPGCMSPEDTWDPEASVTITSGVYGQTVASCPQVGVPCTLQPAADIAVAAYEGAGLPTATSQPAQTAISDERGFFELPLPTGTYRLCRGVNIDGSFMPSSCSGAATWVDGTVRSDLF